MVEVMQDINSTTHGGVTGRECGGQTHQEKKESSCTDMAERHARSRERRKGTSQLQTKHTYRTNDETHLWSMHSYAGCFHSMPAKTAAMLSLVKSAQFIV